MTSSGTTQRRGRILVGTSGWRYAKWRGDFYPTGLRQRDELRYVAERLGTVEINGSFYSLQRPSSYERWRDETPDDFVFAVKGSRYISHLLALRNTEQALANFWASGVLALGPKLGPILWQLPERIRFDAEVIDRFLALLPRTTAEAASLAEGHDERVAGRSYTRIDRSRPIRHAIEVRHPTFADEAFSGILRSHDVALVVADTAGKWPLFREATSRIQYVRLHGSRELYASRYLDDELEAWAAEIDGWASAGRDVYVYFDNDIHGYAPYDALALARLVEGRFPARREVTRAD